MNESPVDAGDTRDDVRTGLSVEAFKRAYEDNLRYALGRFPEVATRNDRYLALAYAVRDRLMDRWIRTGEAYYRSRARTVCYLSAEFLLGPHLGNNLLNLGVLAEARQAIEELGLDFDALLDQEEEPGLGNGGLGRLAACYMDSLATLQVPAIGYGIRYEFGIFDQVIRDGWQVEITDKWLHLGNPWEIARPEIAFEVGLGGHTEWYEDEAGRGRVRWIPDAGGARARPTTPRSSATAWATPTSCACGGPRPPSRSTSRPSTWGTTGARSRRRSAPRRSARSSTRTTSRWPGSGSAWPSSTSSSPARCRT